jgi:phosphoribosylaminoimidazolecarboxamide formyltransferase/IMP cyclohydrolase|tara:strand:- start:1034 stop:2557 length:1524 start_codon:yes stop_codon:yes gene_type:complete
MSDKIKIKNALISVFDKNGLENIIRKLSEFNIEIYSTGGTESFIKNLDIDVNKIEDLTTYPSILGGRVKTLHPNVFGGILARRDNDQDQEQLINYNIPEFDLVIVDLYPFEETVKNNNVHSEIIEKIDIGGISLIRAGAKNYKDVIVISQKEQYSDLLKILENQGPYTDIATRKKYAAEAFNLSSHYDTLIFKYLNIKNKPIFKESEKNSIELRYGENPHQKGYFFGNISDMFEQLNGKELSYNNLLDIDAAVNLISEFNESTFAILKHNNACGISSRDNLRKAFQDALAGDPISAFGGILITNREIDIETAEEVNKLFYEVLIAPNFSNEALDLLKTKTKRVLLKQKNINLPKTQFRTILSGVLFQDKDLITDDLSIMKTVTKKAPSKEELENLVFASKVCKHTKSNTIVFANNKQLLASGVGQTSRVDALKQAVNKAKNFNMNLVGSVMASDAFFPFPDCVELAKKSGVSSVIQPGGSIKDNLSIDYCDENDLSMIMTSTRHFKH